MSDQLGEDLAVIDSYLTGPDEPCEPSLALLSNWIKLTAENEAVRAELANSEEVWTKLDTVVDRQVKVVLRHDSATRDQLRVIRGLVLLVRNLIPGFDGISSEKAEDIRAIVSALGEAALLRGFEMEREVFVSCVQCLSNVLAAETKFYVTFEPQIFEMQLIGAFAKSKVNDEESWRAMMRFVTYLAQSRQFVTWVSGQYYDDFRLFLLKLQKEADSKDEQWLTVSQIQLFLELITNPRFSRLIIQSGDDTTMLDLLLRHTQIIVGSKDVWKDEQLLNIASWLNNYVKCLLRLLTDDESQEEETTLKRYEYQLSRSLDSVSSLLRFDSVKKMMDERGFLDTVLSLLDFASRKKRKDLDLDQDMDLDEEKAGIKGLLLEIVAYLSENNKKNQDEVRERHCLEHILNGTNLDMDEPYIRERSILCLKALLNDNAENQEFVKKLEPEKVAMNDKRRKLLEESGYDVKIIDGKVAIKPKPKVENLDSP